MDKKEVILRLKNKISLLKRNLVWYDEVIGKMAHGCEEARQVVDEREEANNDIVLYESILEIIG